MAGPLLFDRVRETSTTTGSGSFTLSGSAASGGYRRFQDVLSTNDTAYYVIQNTSAAEWEVGLGTFTSPTTLARTTILASSNSGSAVSFSAGTKDVWIDLPAAAASVIWANNYLINPFTFAQRQVATSPTTISADAYGPDRWRCHRENADLTFNTSTNSATAPNNRYGTFLKTTNNGKILIDQPVDTVTSWALMGKSVTFQVSLATTTSTATYKIALVEWQSTVDQLTAAAVTTWGANTVDPTLAASYSVVAKTTCSCTTTFQTFTVSGVPSTSCSNLVAMIWSDSQLTAGGAGLYAANPALYVGSGPQPVQVAPPQVELAKCQRYCYVVTVPSSATGKVGTGFKVNGTILDWVLSFPVTMRAEPTLFSNVSGWLASGNPTTTTIASFDPVAAAAITITGALTLSGIQSTTQGTLRATAGTSFSGTNGTVNDLRLGPSVVLGWSAEL